MLKEEIKIIEDLIAQTISKVVPMSVATEVAKAISPLKDKIDALEKANTASLKKSKSAINQEA